jgi:transcriptional regulator with XRE-family HTH domain
MSQSPENSEDPDLVRMEERELARMGLVARIQARMTLLGLNPYSTAKKAGLGGDYVRDLIRGKVTNPSAERLGKLAVALETSLYYLMGQEENPGLGARDNPDIWAPPPLPSPVWTEARGQPAANMLPIRYELMEGAFRRATEVTRGPLGFEPSSAPPSADGGRRLWWEYIRDDTISAIAPRGSLLLVAEYKDTERALIQAGDIVVVQRRIVAADNAAYHLVERSVRQVRRRDPTGMWYMTRAPSGPPQDDDDTVEVWRFTMDSPGSPGHAAQIAAWEQELLRPGIDDRHRDYMRCVMEMMRTMSPDEIERAMHEDRDISEYQFAGKGLRVLTPVAAGAGFGL